jgi:hypothetical protein
VTEHELSFASALSYSTGLPQIAHAQTGAAYKAALQHTGSMEYFPALSAAICKYIAIGQKSASWNRRLLPPSSMHSTA